jgi:hypothetical protein
LQDARECIAELYQLFSVYYSSTAYSPSVQLMAFMRLKASMILEVSTVRAIRK